MALCVSLFVGERYPKVHPISGKMIPVVDIPSSSAPSQLVQSSRKVARVRVSILSLLLVRPSIHPLLFSFLLCVELAIHPISHHPRKKNLMPAPSSFKPSLRSDSDSSRVFEHLMPPPDRTSHIQSHLSAGKSSSVLHLVSKVHPKKTADSRGPSRSEIP